MIPCNGKKKHDAKLEYKISATGSVAYVDPDEALEACQAAFEELMRIAGSTEDPET